MGISGRLVSAIVLLTCLHAVDASGHQDMEYGPSMEEAAAREIAELHEFFEDWFNGTLPDTDEAFRRFAGVMAEEFVIVSPTGEESTRADLVHRLRQAHRSDPGIEIDVEEIRLIAEGGDLIVARYEELQESAAESTHRISTVVFRHAPDTPNGLQWLRVHETWAPPGK